MLLSLQSPYIGHSAVHSCLQDREHHLRVWQNVKNGNIYFNDQEYGKINIVATDKRIPCGSIIKIKNSNIAKEVIAIALDRGGAIKETKMDFLVNSEDESARKIGVQKVIYEIVRWGW